MCFEWGMQACHLIFAVIFLSLHRAPYLCARFATVFQFVTWALVLNLVVTANYYWIEGLEFNASWFVQLSLIPFLLCLTYPLVASDLGWFQRWCSRVFCYLCVPTAILGLYVNWQSHATGFQYLATGIITGDVYAFVHHAHSQMGLFKSILPWLMSCLAILAAPAVSRHRATAYFLVTGGYALVTGTKSVLLGLVAVALLYRIRNLPTRMLWFTAAVVIGLAVFAVNFSHFNDILLADGRYFAPVLSSKEFWSRPVGVGYGNYHKAMMRGLYGENPYSQYACSWIHTDMASQYEMYPVAESDWLQVAVCYGWAITLVLLLILARTGWRHLAHYSRRSVPQRTGLYLLVFLVAAGTVQDFLNVQVSWAFYALAVSLMDGAATRRGAPGPRLSECAPGCPSEKTRPVRWP